MSVKQDRAYTRTAADLERKYNFGKTFAEMLGLINDSRDHVDEVESNLRNEVTKEATSIRRDTESIVLEAVRDTVKTSEFEEYKESASAELKVTADGITAKVDTTAQQVTSISGDLDTVKKNVASAETELLSVTNQIAAIHDDLGTIQDGLEGLVKDAEGNANVTETLRKEVETELSVLDERITAEVNARTEKTTEIEADLKSLEGDVTANLNAYTTFKGETESQLDILEDRITAEVTSRTEEKSQIDAEINLMKGDISGVNTELGEITEDITDINGNIDGLDTDMADAKAAITILEEFKDESTARLDVQEAQINAGVSRTEEVYTVVSGTIEDTKNALTEEIEIRKSFQSKTESDLELLSDSMTLSFEKTEQEISDINGVVSSNAEKLEKHFVFDENGLTIKAGAGDMKLVLNNDMIEFYKGEVIEGNRFGWWDGVNFHTGNIEVEVEKRAQFGDFAFVPRSNGSLSFLKVGG